MESWSVQQFFQGSWTWPTCRQIHKNDHATASVSIGHNRSIYVVRPVNDNEEMEDCVHVCVVCAGTCDVLITVPVMAYAWWMGRVSVMRGGWVMAAVCLHVPTTAAIQRAPASHSRLAFVITTTMVSWSSLLYWLYTPEWSDTILIFASSKFQLLKFQIIFTAAVNTGLKQEGNTIYILKYDCHGVWPWAWLRAGGRTGQAWLRAGGPADRRTAQI